MKTLLSAFISVAMVNLFANSSNAQTYNGLTGLPAIGSKYNNADGRYAPEILPILQNQYAQREEKRKKAALKITNAAGERLKAFCGYNFQDTSYLPYGRSDSGYYYYSGTRSSFFNYQMMNYSSPCYATYTSPVGDNYPLDLMMEPGNYTPVRLELFPDSVYVWNSFNPSGTPYGFADIAGYQFTGSKLIQTTNKYYPAIPGETDRSGFYYDSLGNFTKAYYFKYDTTSHAWDTLKAEILFYNSFNQMTEDSISSKSGSGIWNENNKTVCTYGGNGYANEIIYYTDSSGYWQPQTMRYLYYNTDSTLRSDSLCQYNIGLWTPYTKDSFSYTPGISYFTYGQTELFESGSVWAKSSYTKNVDLSGLPDTLNYRYFGGNFGPVSMQMAGKKIYFIYDTANNPILAKSFNYTLTDTLTGTGIYGASPERVFYYYYEYYNETETRNISTAPETILFYPNPTTNELSISRPDVVSGSTTQIIVTNLMGQTIFSERLRWINKTETISLTGIAPGTCFISVQDYNGKILATQKILKM